MVASRLQIKFTLFPVFTLAAIPVTFAPAVEPSLEETYAVIAGVLEWRDTGLSSFPKENRKDRELYQTLLERGVPKQNMVLLLDDEATGAGMWRAVEQVASRAKPGSTLLFYYAGHGTKNDGRAYFCNYDYVSGRAAQTGFSIDRIDDVIAAHFRGKRVLFTADCCYSGTLIAPAKALSESGYQAAILTSAAASNTSTSYWTFTQTIIDAIRGDPLLDRNHDGVIALKEAAWELQAAMKHCEMQLAGYANYGVDGDFPLAEVDGKMSEHGEIPTPYCFGQYVYAMPQGNWRKGRIFDHREGKFKVRLQYYSERPLVWLPADKIKPIEFRTYPAGTNLSVLWKKKEWRARVLKTVDDFHYITYPGYSSDWDEWVAVNRIVGIYENVIRAAKVNVVRGRTWYPAVILNRKNSNYLVHYTGEDTSWDEWVGADRIRGLPASGAATDKDSADRSAEAARLKRASVGGKYRKLLRTIAVPADARTYGPFTDYGQYDGDTWAGYRNLPAGYWVYVAPNWYIWAEKADD